MTTSPQTWSGPATSIWTSHATELLADGGLSFAGMRRAAFQARRIFEPLGSTNSTGYVWYQGLGLPCLHQRLGLYGARAGPALGSFCHRRRLGRFPFVGALPVHGRRGLSAEPGLPRAERRSRVLSGLHGP